MQASSLPLFRCPRSAALCTCWSPTWNLVCPGYSFPRLQATMQDLPLQRQSWFKCAGSQQDPQNLFCFQFKA